MTLKYSKPNTPAQRGHVAVDTSKLSKVEAKNKRGDLRLVKVKPEKSLTVGLRKKGGRNNNGRITCRHKGGGHKRLYRMIDFKRLQDFGSAVVRSIQYDPNRTSFIALIENDSFEKAYILAPQGLDVGSVVSSGEGSDIEIGNRMALSDIPVGTNIYNIEMKPKKGGQIARSAGVCAVLIAKDSNYAQIKMPSGEFRLIPLSCCATIGMISNPDHQNIKIGKAGRNRWNGKRPTVRGVAMNPVDHPHGGGEGKTSGGRHPVSPWGQSAKGKKTRSNKRTSKFIVRKRGK